MVYDCVSNIAPIHCDVASLEISNHPRFSKLHCNMVHDVSLIHRFHTYSTLQCAPPSYVCRSINPMNSIAYYSCKVS